MAQRRIWKLPVNAEPADRTLFSLFKKPARIDSVSLGSNFPDPGLMFGASDGDCPAFHSAPLTRQS